MKKVINPLFKTTPLFYQPLLSYCENLNLDFLDKKTSQLNYVNRLKKLFFQGISLNHFTHESPSTIYLFTIHQYTFRNLYIWKTMLTGKKPKTMKGIGVITRLTTIVLRYFLLKIYKPFLQTHLDYGGWMGKPGCHLALAMSAMSSDTEGHCAAATALTDLDASTLYA